MTADLQIDEALLEQAKTLAGLPTNRETINEDLKEFIQSRQRQEFIQMQGQVEYFEDYNHKSLRSKKQP